MASFKSWMNCGGDGMGPPPRGFEGGAAAASSANAHPMANSRRTAALQAATQESVIVPKNSSRKALPFVHNVSGGEVNESKCDNKQIDLICVVHSAPPFI